MELLLILNACDSERNLRELLSQIPGRSSDLWQALLLLAQLELFEQEGEAKGSSDLPADLKAEIEAVKLRLESEILRLQETQSAQAENWKQKLEQLNSADQSRVRRALTALCFSKISSIQKSRNALAEIVK